MSPTSRTYGVHPDQMYEIFEGKGPDKPTLVLLHGGYWRAQHDREHLRPLALALHALGWPVILAEYRRSPHSPHETVSDIETLINVLAPQQVVVIGFSVGGQLALLTSGHHDHIQQVIALAPVTDLVTSEMEDLGEGAVRTWLNESAFSHPELDPLRSTPIRSQLTIFHGSDDVRVPLEHSRRYLAHCHELGAEPELIEITGAGHFDLIDPLHPYFEKLVNVLNR